MNLLGGHLLGQRHVHSPDHLFRTVVVQLKVIRTEHRTYSADISLDGLRQTRRDTLTHQLVHRTHQHRVSCLYDYQ